MKKQEYYEEIWACRNCEEPNTIHIPLGTNLIDFLRDEEVICDRCGCLIYSGCSIK